jgi:hypothetical protein
MYTDVLVLILVCFMVATIRLCRCPHCSYKSLVLTNAGPCCCPKCGKVWQPHICDEIPQWIWLGVLTVLSGSLLLLQ